MQLKDRTALITGSSRGIGKEIAILFAKEGAKVVVNYSKSEKEALIVVDEIKNMGSEAIAVKCDVSKEEEVSAMVDACLRRFGKLDILVNNAGIAQSTEIESAKEEWIEMIDTNLLGVFLCCKHASRHMVKDRYGRIINISSIRGLFEHGRPGLLAYNASKAGVISLTKTLAKELAPDITVNSVAPGWTNTDMTKGIGKKLRGQELAKMHIKRFADAKEIAYAALYFASDNSGYTTGQVLAVDGGYTLS